MRTTRCRALHCLEDVVIPYEYCVECWLKVNQALAREEVEGIALARTDKDAGGIARRLLTITRELMDDRDRVFKQARLISKVLTHIRKDRDAKAETADELTKALEDMVSPPCKTCGHAKCKRGETHYFGDDVGLRTGCLVGDCTCSQYVPDDSKAWRQGYAALAAHKEETGGGCAHEFEFFDYNGRPASEQHCHHRRCKVCHLSEALDD